MKQPKLKIGQQYRVIKDGEYNVKKGTLVTVIKIENDGENDSFYDENGHFWWFITDKLQLITPNEGSGTGGKYLLKKYNITCGVEGGKLKQPIDNKLESGSCGTPGGEVGGGGGGGTYTPTCNHKNIKKYFKSTNPGSCGGELKKVIECDDCGMQLFKSDNNKVKKEIEKLDTNKDWDIDDIGIKVNDIIDYINLKEKKND